MTKRENSNYFYFRKYFQNRDKLRESESFVITLQKDKSIAENSKVRLNVKKIISLVELIKKPYSKVTIELKEDYKLERNQRYFI